MRTVLTLLITLLFTAHTSAQGWDYEKYPPLKIDIEHLNADLNIERNGRLTGDVLYRAEVKSPRLDSLELHAAGLEILSVEIGGAEVPFILRDDKMIITPLESLERADTFELRIRYASQSQFGLHINTRGTIWTSMLPRTTRHWLPVKDHPRERFTTELIFTFPAGFEVVATGRRTESEVVSVDEEQVTFRSDIPVSPVHLVWAMGELNPVSQEELDFNSVEFQQPVRITVHAETQLSDTLNFTELAENALSSAASQFNESYPLGDLHIVILDESYGETKSYGSGVVFAYRDKPYLAEQVQSGILSQWAGVMVSEVQWVDPDAILALHSFAANRIFNLQADTLQAKEPYGVFSNNSFSSWRRHLTKPEFEMLNASLETVFRDIFDKDYNILGWNDISRIIYQNTGLSFFDGFDPEPVTVEPEDVNAMRYRANVEWNEADQTVEVSFESINRPVEELVTVTAVEKRFDGTREHTLTFTGQQDRSVISVSPNIENIQLSTGREDIELRVSKPFIFWIDQLRNDPDPEKRVVAAEALAGFSDNPDLQLALNDLLQMESHPQVYAEILRSLSKLTAGDAGMDQRFLPYLSEDRNRAVRLAAIEALGNFEGNEQVISRLRSIALASEEPELKREAIISLSRITNSERYTQLVNDLVTRESLLREVPLLLQTLAEKGEDAAVVEIASTFITPQFPYEVRHKSLDLLIEYDRSPQSWADRIPALFSDPHPNIRITAAKALSYLTESDRREVVPALLGDSYDERVRRAIESAVN